MIERPQIHTESKHKCPSFMSVNSNATQNLSACHVISFVVVVVVVVVENENEDSLFFAHGNIICNTELEAANSGKNHA